MLHPPVKQNRDPFLGRAALVIGGAGLTLLALGFWNAVQTPTAITLTPSTIEVGPWPAGAKRHLKVWIENPSSIPVTIQGGEYYCMPEACFFAECELPITLQPGEGTEYAFRFSRNLPGDFDVEHNIYTSWDKVLKVRLVGTATAPTVGAVGQ